MGKKVSRRVLKVHYEFSCFCCGMQFKINVASLRGVAELVACPCCLEPAGPRGFFLVDERVVCSVPAVGRLG